MGLGHVKLDLLCSTIFQNNGFRLGAIIENVFFYVIDLLNHVLICMLNILNVFFCQWIFYSREILTTTHFTMFVTTKNYILKNTKKSSICYSKNWIVQIKSQEVNVKKKVELIFFSTFSLKNNVNAYILVYDL